MLAWQPALCDRIDERCPLNLVAQRVHRYSVRPVEHGDRMKPVLATLWMIALPLAQPVGAQGTRTVDAPPSDALYKASGGPHDVRAFDALLLHDAQRDKELQLRITWPDAAGPHPVIVWSHGASGTKDDYQPLVQHWASHGYVCVQMNHSDSRALADGPRNLVDNAGRFRDWANRPKDIIFTLDALDDIESKVPGLDGKVDHAKVGVGGHSFGAHTAQLIAGTTTVEVDGTRQSHADPRPLAFVLISPQGRGAQLDDESWAHLTRPALSITGSLDPGRNGEPIAWRLDPFHFAPPQDKFLLFIEGAQHGFGGITGTLEYRNAGPDDPEHLRWVQSTTIAFWDAYLKEDAAAAAFLRSDRIEDASAGEATLRARDDEAGANTQSGSTATWTPGTGMEVTSTDVTWFDATRQREVPVRIVAPALDEGRGPFPVVVFSHGGGESREAYGYLAEPLARSGYIALFLTHRGSDRDTLERQGRAALGASPFEHRTQDVSFVIDQLLSDALNEPLLRDRVAPDRIAVAGQCAGATTALAIAGLTAEDARGERVSYVDPRPKVVIALSPQPANPSPRARGVRLHEESWSTVKIPALVITGTKDFQWIPAVRRDPGQVNRPFDVMPPGDKYLVEIDGAEHHAFTDSPPYYPGGPRDPRHHTWIVEAVLGFLDAYLGGDAAARQWLEDEQLERVTAGACRQERKDAAETGNQDRLSQPTSVPPQPDAPRPERPGTATTTVQVERMFQFFDRDRDGELSKEEMPERLRPGFDRMDTDSNGAVSKHEMTVALEGLQHRGGSGVGGDGPRETPRRESPRRSFNDPAPTRTPAPAQNMAPEPGVGWADSILLYDATRDKHLNVRVTWPEQQSGTFPVILFSHSVGGSRDDYQPLVQHWARNGYVIIQADHSDARNQASAGNRLDWVNRARDLSFLIDSLAEIESTTPDLTAKLDTQNVGVGGHLIGAYAACVLAGQQNFSPNAPQNLKDERVAAALLLSPQGRGQGLTEASWRHVTGPLMVLSGSQIPSARTGNPAEWRVEPYTFSPPGDKYLVWIEGLTGTYARLIQPDTGDDDPHAARWIRDTSLAFWDAHLKNDVDARNRLCAWPLSADDSRRLRIECK